MATLKTGWIKKLINGVSEKIFAISHVKSVYYNYTNNITLDDKLTELEDELKRLSDDPIDSPVFTNSVSMGRKADTVVGTNSTALGSNTTASGKYSHAEGGYTTASGSYSHAEGYGTTASGNYSHAEGAQTTASGDKSHAEGNSSNKATDVIADISSATNDDIITAWTSKKFSLAKGEASHVSGKDCLALAIDSYAEGYATTASGHCSHAEGAQTTAIGSYSHVEGDQTTAIGDGSHAEGYATTASGHYSHAEGGYTIALTNQHAQGHYNNTTTATANNISGTSTGTAFVIGNGTSSSPSNAFRVTGDGYVYSIQASMKTGADYSELFEWQDENENNEDRVGKFVTFDTEKKIRIANKDDDYILGIVSGNPAIIGNADECWRGRYVTDDFGRFITEEVEEQIEEINEETGETETKTIIVTKWKENEEYDPQSEYIQRIVRKEWDAIGMVGVLPVYDDGTCTEHGYCTVSDGGIATACVRSESINTYKVLKRVTDNIVEVLFK